VSVGERITELRKAAGLSQLDISRALDISRQAVSKWENDTSSPDVLNLIKLADLLDTEVEYLATGRKTYGRRPPVVIKTTETIEKIVEKPVIQTVETVVEHIVEKPVVKTIEKPVIKKVYRKQYVRNSSEFFLVGILSFLAGLIIGTFL
jgi:transcriptional regulator with XRE-family HTH domain